MELTPVEQRTLSDEAAHRLRAAIRNGSLRPGDKLVERDLAERLGMSRMPVREAIQRLAEEGLVQKLPHRTPVVYTLTGKEIDEISSLRVVLERFVMERVIDRWKAEYEQDLRQIVNAMRQAANDRDVQELYNHDYLFHRTLWQIADHSLMLEVISGLRIRISRFLSEANGSLSPSDLANHIDSHEELISVIKSGDKVRAKDEMTVHVLGAKQRILQYFQLNET